MLVNEFDLDLDNIPDIKSPSKFYWLQVRNKVDRGLRYHLNVLMKRHQKGKYENSPILCYHLYMLLKRHRKGTYKISPNYNIVIN